MYVQKMLKGIYISFRYKTRTVNVKKLLDTVVDNTSIIYPGNKRAAVR